MSKYYFRSQLLAAMLAVAMPLLALEAYTLWSGYESAKEEAHRAVQSQSKQAADGIDDLLERGEALLTFLSRRHELKELRPESCAEFLKDLPSLERAYQNLTLISSEGAWLCGTGGDFSQIRDMADSEWFEPALKAQSFHLSKPFLSRISSMPVILLTLPLRGPNGRTKALLGLSFSIKDIADSMPLSGMPGNSSSVLVSGDDTMIARNPNPEKWVGKRVGAATTRLEFATHDGLIEGEGADGIRRVYASTNLQRYGLRVSSGVPTDAIYRPLWQGLWGTLGIAAVLGLLAGWFAFAGSARLARPLAALTRAMRAYAGGHSDARAPSDLPAEFGVLGGEFNHMLELRARASENLLASEQRAVRLSGFYEALSRTNQAIAARLAPQELFEAVAHICVESGPAHMAWVARLDRDQLQLVAWAGRAKDFTETAPSDIVEHGPGLTALKEGHPCVVQDYENDPRTASYAQRGKEFGVASSAAFPLRQAGRVVGVLSLYLQEAHAFDDQLVGLLEDMANDVSFALDNHARDLALQRRESQLAGIIETAMDALITVDSSMHIVVFNRAACKMFETNGHDMRGQPLRKLLPDEVADVNISRLLKSPDLGLGEPRSEICRCAALRLSGEEFPVQASCSRAGTDEDALITIIVRDISEQERAERDRQAAAMSEAANKAKTEFLTRTSHELRTPLNAVIGFSQLLQVNARDRLDPHERHQLDLIFLAGNQLRALIDDVLDVSRIEAGHMTVVLRDLDLKHLLNGVLRMCDAQAKSSGVTLEEGYAEQPPILLHSDPIRLRQVFLNLVSNAIKYNKRGGLVRVEVERHEDCVNVRVTDTGIGMSAGQMRGLFEPYNRLGRERTDIAGTGIGLLLTRQLLELMGCSLKLTSTEGHGTEACVELPYVDSSTALPAVIAPKTGGALQAETRGDAAVSVRASEASEVDAKSVATLEVPTAPQAAPSVSGSVLYIEDNPVNVHLVAQLLRRWPQVQLHVAEDAASGLAHAFRAPPDLILLDMHLPDAEGVTVLSTLRADSRTANLPIVALSASAMEWETKAALSAGADRYWAKPIDFAQFLEGVADILGRRPGLSAAHSSDEPSSELDRPPHP